MTDQMVFGLNDPMRGLPRCKPVLKVDTETHHKRHKNRKPKHIAYQAWLRWATPLNRAHVVAVLGPFLTCGGVL